MHTKQPMWKILDNRTLHMDMDLPTIISYTGLNNSGAGEIVLSFSSSNFNVIRHGQMDILFTSTCTVECS